MEVWLCIDFGSTYTKLTAIDPLNARILATGKALTTVNTDIIHGYEDALHQVKNALPDPHVTISHTYACSSAAGGLKMVAIGLVPELTAEAAKRAALGAGARMLGVYSYELTSREVDEIRASQPDIILLAGGTDGGNKSCILHNASWIAEHLPDVPVVVAGNKNAVDEIESLFTERGMYFKIARNVMPRLNELSVESAREAIRDVFLEKIIEAKGMQHVESFIDGLLMPTPAAVLQAAQLLADGTDREEGIGALIVLDIGGATTDVHSLCEGEPTQPGVAWTGLQEPYAKRTVEGDLGMRVSAQSLWEAAGSRRIRRYLGNSPFEIEARCRALQAAVDIVPSSDEERAFDQAMAQVAAELAMERHAGTIQAVYTPLGTVHQQIGKDLLAVRYVLGTGGVLVHSEHPEQIVGAGCYSSEQPGSLKPRDPHVLIDSLYILSAMGLLAEFHPNVALRIMKSYIVEGNGVENYGVAQSKVE